MQKELEFPASFCGLQEKKKKKHSERHGTCTHSSCYPLLWEGWQLHHSESKILKPILGSRAFFFLFFSLRSGNQGSDRHHRIHFISHAASAPAVVILWGLRMTPRHFVVIFNIKYPLRDYLMFCSVYSPPPPTCFSLNARQIEHLSWLLHLKEPSSILHSML